MYEIVVTSDRIPKVYIAYNLCCTVCKYVKLSFNSSIIFLVFACLILFLFDEGGMTKAQKVFAEVSNW